MHRKATEFYVSVLYSTLLTVLIRPKSVLEESLECLIIEPYQLHISILFYYLFFCLFPLTALAKISSTILNQSRGNGHCPNLISDDILSVILQLVEQWL